MAVLPPPTGPTTKILSSSSGSPGAELVVSGATFITPHSTKKTKQKLRANWKKNRIEGEGAS